MKESGIRKMGEVDFCGDSENPYIYAFVSLQCQLGQIEEMNDMVPQAIQSFVASKYAMIDRKTVSNLMEQIQQNLKEAGFGDKVDVSHSLNYLKQQLENYKRIEQIMEQATREMKAKGMKKGFLGVNPNTEIGRAILEGVRYKILPQRFITLIRNMSLVYLVALFENYLRNVLQTTMQREPRVMMTSQKNITYEELLKFNSVDKARREIIEREISIVDEDLEKVARYFDEKLNVKLEDFRYWNLFKERFYRRNIIIHNSAYPNKLYRQKTRYKGKNKRMDVSSRYLRLSVELFSKLAWVVSIRLSEKFICSPDS